MDALSNEVLSTAREALELAQSESAEAEIALIESSARAEVTRESVARLESAVAALSGEMPSAAYVSDGSVSGDFVPVERAGKDLSSEEFDKQRKKRQRAREKELEAQNPLAHIKCSGCGVKGKLVDSIITAPSGAQIRMMICGKCGNQTMS